MPNFVRKILHFNRKITHMDADWREHFGANEQRGDTEGQAFKKVCTDHLEEMTVETELPTAGSPEMKSW